MVYRRAPKARDVIVVAIVMVWLIPTVIGVVGCFMIGVGNGRWVKLIEELCAEKAVWTDREERYLLSLHVDSGDGEYGILQSKDSGRSMYVYFNTSFLDFYSSDADAYYQLYHENLEKLGSACWRYDIKVCTLTVDEIESKTQDEAFFLDGETQLVFSRMDAE